MEGETLMALPPGISHKRLVDKLVKVKAEVYTPIIQQSWHTETTGGKKNAGRALSPKIGPNLNASVQPVTDYTGDILLHVLFYICQSSALKRRWKQELALRSGLRKGSHQYIH